jgi:hypothetical protein
LSRITGRKREEECSWTEEHYDEIHGLISLPNIIRLIKSRRMRWAGYVTHGEGKDIKWILIEKHEGETTVNNTT